ncbi:PEGA domain protein [compost metagenome]
MDPPPIVPERVEPAPAAAAPAPAPQAAPSRPAPRVEPDPPSRTRVDPPAPRPAPAPGAAATGEGTLQVLSRPAGASVTVDGQIVGRTPLVISNVRAGAHDVRIELAGFRRWSTSVDVRPGVRARVAASLEQ